MRDATILIIDDEEKMRRLMDLVLRPEGYRLLKVISKEPAGQRELADPRVQQAVRSQLRDRREQLLKAAYYEILRNSAKVENYYAKKVLDSNGMVK